MDVSFSGENLVDIEEKILKQADEIRERRRTTLRGEAYVLAYPSRDTLELRVRVNGSDAGHVVADEQTAQELRQKLTDWLVSLQRGMTVLHGFRQGPEAPVAWDAPLRASAGVLDPEAALSTVAGTLISLRCAAMKRGGQYAAGVAEACDAIGAVIVPVEMPPGKQGAFELSDAASQFQRLAE